MNKAVQRKIRRSKAIAEERAGRRGPEGAITPALVKRIAHRFALGVPLQYAIVMEEAHITPKAFEKALQRNAKLSAHMTRAKALSSSGTKPANSERFKTGHSAVQIS